MVFERQRLYGPGQELPLLTRTGRRIVNEIAPEPGDHELRTYDLLRKLHGAEWKPRRPLCGVYNCFGMVFGSRRTAIGGNIDEILEDDGYRKLREGEKPFLGDIALYQERTKGLLHVALVIGIEEKPLYVVWVLSKWNDCTGEDYHRAYQHIWPTTNGYEMKVEFRTDRP